MSESPVREQHVDNAAFEKAVRRCIPSEFLLIAGQEDAAEAMESYSASSLFELPNTIGEEGGVATSSLLQYLYSNVNYVVSGADNDTSKWLTCKTVIKAMHKGVSKAKFRSVPQMSCSRPLDERPFYIVPPGYTGRRRALLIGVNFIGDLELRAPHNDVHNIQHFLTTQCGFLQEDLLVLKDDGKHTSPTKKNIEDGFKQMVTTSKPKDVLFVFYSGHGALVKDLSGDEVDGYDSSILPVDYKTVGNILDDYILKELIKALPESVYTNMVVDCCHSGTVGDLPFIMRANSPRQEIEPFFDTDTYQEMLEKEAAAGKAKDERRKAKEERKRQREIRKKQRDKEMQEAEEKMAELAANPTYLAQSPEAIPGSQVPLTPSGPTTTTETFEVGSEEEANALAAKFGMALTINDEQRDVMSKGGKIVLTFTKSMTPTPTVPIMPEGNGAPTAKTFEISSIEEADALSAQFGTTITLDDQQRDVMAKGGKVQLTFFTM